MNPKISDFGMARMFTQQESTINTNRIVGTYGYMSPEYAMEGICSTKSDVYSFGVLLLEETSPRRKQLRKFCFRDTQFDKPTPISPYEHLTRLRETCLIWRSQLRESFIGRVCPLLVSTRCPVVIFASREATGIPKRAPTRCPLMRPCK
ncbi:unnamed protein product [Vicia faba]|uniref:Protein kinase domain-containing protein n=1 Tax=Vicia faba TaxID=3906 RepID=A0AAV0Z8P3_VICFA|nr:unnamed protein product [Vicia faba]